jgi:HK97 gp10 family phage protein
VKDLSARLRALIGALAALDVRSVAQDAILKAAEGMRDAVQDRLSHAPGGPHDAPWEVTGALRDSIGVSQDGDVVRVGSTDPVAVYQELGTVGLPPRPFLGPVAAAEGEGAAQAIGSAVRDAIAKAVA